MKTNATRGVLLFAHGARDPDWAVPFQEVARIVRQRDASIQVQLAFLEFMSPALHEAGRVLAEAGCAQVDIVPLFLGAGGHVRKDLPALLEQLASDHPDVRWRLQHAIGEIDSVIDAMATATLHMVDEGRA